MNFTHDEATLKSNRLTILAFLKRGPSTTDDIADHRMLQEAYVTAWTQIGRYDAFGKASRPELTFHRVSKDEELHITLIRLVEYLGHSNPFLVSLAYSNVGSPSYITILRFFLTSPSDTSHRCSPQGNPTNVALSVLA